MTVSLSTLIRTYTPTALFTRAIEFAASLGLPVTSWREDDPTRAQFTFQATVLAEMDAVVSQFIKSGFLSTAEDDWLTLHAQEVFNVTREEATYATPTVTLTNTGGGFYPRAAGDLVLKSSATGKTFTSTSDGTLSSGATVTFNLIADEAGSDSSVDTDEIDELVTTLLGVEVVSSTRSLANDQQSPASLIAQCKATTAALSPNGPADAYEYVARSSALTGTSIVTRAHSVTSGDHEVTVYVAGADGAVDAPTVALVQAAIDTWATPLTITATAASAVALPVNFDIEIAGDDLPADIADLIESRLESFFLGIDMGESVALSRLIKEIHLAHENITSVTLVAPVSILDPDDHEILTVGTIDVTEV